MAKDRAAIAAASKQLSDWIRAAWSRAADGLTWREATALALQLADLGYSAAAEWKATPGDQKKAWVMAQVKQLLEGLAPLLPLPLLLRPFRGWLLPPFIEFVLAAVSVVIELIHRRAKPAK